MTDLEGGGRNGGKRGGMKERGEMAAAITTSDVVIASCLFATPPGPSSNVAFAASFNLSKIISTTNITSITKINIMQSIS